ncbi:MAG: NAD-dependent epimerase/dehydratase family protein [Bacteroidales bacterium]|nr:NAD-dependent epimerase/dehydratase family protein [Bacteroidales bacterium]
MAKRIFITGASGFIGKSVVERLIREDYQLSLLLLPNESAEIFPDMNIIRGDITRPETLAGKLSGHDTLIHIAGSVGFQTWEDCLHVNVEGTRNICREALAANIRRFIYMSSVSVYGRVPDIAIAEEQPYKKIRDPYGDTKIEAELLLKQLARESGLEVTILRPTAVYGQGDNKFLPKLMENLRSGKFRMMGDGNHSVDLVNVIDVAESVSLALQKDDSIGQTYNIANEQNPSWNEFLKVVAGEMNLPYTSSYISYKIAYRIAGLMELMSRITGKPPRLSRYAVRLVGRQYNYVIDKAKDELGFRPSVKLLDGIRSCIRESNQTG